MGFDTQIAIVGAGPAGLVIAHLLNRAGISFVLLERQQRDERGVRPKAGLIEYRTACQLRQAGLGEPVLYFMARNSRCEFRSPAGSAVLDYAALTGGRPHYIHPQHLLVARLAEVLLTGPQAAGPGQVRFGQLVEHVSDGPGEAVLTVRGPDGARSEIRCEAVIGCDGSRSSVASAMTCAKTSTLQLPARWLVITGDAAPLEEHTIYATHPHGFAGHMRRGPAQTRYYLEVPAADTPRQWPARRIRSELSARLRAAGRLDDVPLRADGCLDLRVAMTEPMQQGRLFLAGDAAHLITPAGGKGMNLAIQDALELAGGLIERFGPKGDPARLEAYSQTRLPAIWRTQAFSHWFLQILLAGHPGALSGGLRSGWVGALASDPLLATWFAHAYAGVNAVCKQAPAVDPAARRAERGGSSSELAAARRFWAQCSGN